MSGSPSGSDGAVAVAQSSGSPAWGIGGASHPAVMVAVLGAGATVTLESLAVSIEVDALYANVQLAGDIE